MREGCSPFDGMKQPTGCAPCAGRKGGTHDFLCMGRELAVEAASAVTAVNMKSI